MKTVSPKRIAVTQFFMIVVCLIGFLVTGYATYIFLVQDLASGKSFQLKFFVAPAFMLYFGIQSVLLVRARVRYKASKKDQ